ncbi:MAG TPA: 2'-5' RNA ligase family protein [Ktedonobacterales bacterium]|jgi:2'-5' RNA ligase
MESAVWAVVIFPALQPAERQAIDRIRAAYDPLAAVIDPHITLVFPFEKTISPEDLLAHMRQAVELVVSFEIELRSVTGQEGQWLFLNVKRGNDQIIALHDSLYSGPLAPYHQPRFTYAPHLTVGHVAPGEPFETALHDAVSLTATFQTVVREITAYRIAEHGVRGERYSVPLATAL